MQTTEQAIRAAGFKWVVVNKDEPLLGYWSLELANQTEITLEPLMFDQMLLAVYTGGRLLVDKIPFKPLHKENQL